MHRALSVFLVFLYLLITSWFYSNVYPINLVILLPLLFVYRAKLDQALLVSFAAGLVFDLTNLTPLGLSSAVFLAVTLVFHYILTNTIKENLLFLLFFIFLADIAFHWVVFHHLGINKSFIYSILFLLIYLGAFKKWSILKRDKNIYLK